MSRALSIIDSLIGEMESHGKGQFVLDTLILLNMARAKIEAHALIPKHPPIEVIDGRCRCTKCGSTVYPIGLELNVIKFADHTCMPLKAPAL